MDTANDDFVLQMPSISTIAVVRSCDPSSASMTTAAEGSWLPGLDAEVENLRQRIETYVGTRIAARYEVNL